MKKLSIGKQRHDLLFDVVKMMLRTPEFSCLRLRREKAVQGSSNLSCQLLQLSTKG